MLAPEELHILLVEDDDVDAEAILRSFAKGGLEQEIHLARDGLEALEMLRCDTGQNCLPHPYLVILDLNMPRMNGLEFLQVLRDDPALRGTVVFVLTTSDHDRDLLAAYDHQVAGYMLKSRVGKDFCHMIAMLEQYWGVSELPREDPRANSIPHL